MTKQPAKEHVYIYIRDLIIQGKLAAGTFIEEHAISEKIGVSRTPVREAFLRLEAEHFIKLIPRRGAFVHQITAKELANVFEARRLIEIYAANCICTNHTLNLPHGIDELIENMQTADSKQEYMIYIQLDMEFHRRFVAVIGNDVLLEMYDSLQGRKLPLAYATFKTIPKRNMIVTSEHRALWEAFKKRDADKTEEILNKHLQPAFEILSDL